jgi:phage major head subunit gpT-like protein
MALTEQQFIELEGNINAVWDAYYKHKKDFIPDIFNVIKKQTSQFTDYTVGAAGRMTEWEGSVNYDTFEKGYEKQYKPVKYSTGIQIDRDMYEDKDYERIKNKVSSVAYGVHKTLVQESAFIFNNAFATTITGPDGKALCASDHTTIPGAPAQSNTGTNELTYAGLEASMLAMEGFIDDRADKMLIYGDMVIAGPSQRDNCKKLFGSDKEAFVGDNTKNIYKDMSFMIHPLITGNRWFLANKDLMKGGTGLNFFMRRDPRKLERDGATALGDFNTEKLSWKAVGRWVYGWTNFFFVYGNNV